MRIGVSTQVRIGRSKNAIFLCDTGIAWGASSEQGRELSLTRKSGRRCVTGIVAVCGGVPQALEQARDDAHDVDLEDFDGYHRVDQADLQEGRSSQCKRRVRLGC